MFGYSFKKAEHRNLIVGFYLKRYGKNVFIFKIKKSKMNLDFFLGVFNSDDQIVKTYNIILRRNEHSKGLKISDRKIALKEENRRLAEEYGT